MREMATALIIWRYPSASPCIIKIALMRPFRWSESIRATFRGDSTALRINSSEKTTWSIGRTWQGYHHQRQSNKRRHLKPNSNWSRWRQLRWTPMLIRTLLKMEWGRRIGRWVGANLMTSLNGRRIQRSLLMNRTLTYPHQFMHFQIFRAASRNLLNKFCILRRPLWLYPGRNRPKPQKMQLRSPKLPQS